MKGFINNICLYCLLGISLTGCEDWLGGTEPNPPQPQQPVYKEYLEFKVHGVVWKPEVPFSLTGSGTKWFASYIYNNSFAAMGNNLARANDPIKFFKLRHYYTLQIGVNEIPDSSVYPFLFLGIDVGQPLREEFKSIPESAFFYIHYIDTVKHRISGEFSATMINNALDTLELTEGKFDLAMYYEP